jgi:hypothetical protein
MKGQGSFDNIDELFALGAASVRVGDKGRADAALEHLGNAATSIPDRDAKQIAQIMRDELDGLMREAAKDKAGSMAAFARAAALEAKRPADRPVAIPVKPAAELAGERRCARAMRLAQLGSSRPRSPDAATGGVVLGLARAAKAAGKPLDAARAAKEFLAVWHSADTGRSELVQARALAR